MLWLRCLAFSVWLPCALAAQVAPSQPGDSPPIVRKGERFVLEHGRHRLRDLVFRSAELLGRTYLIQSKDVLDAADTVEVATRLELDAARLEEVVSQFMWANGWICTTVNAKDKVYEWLTCRGPRARDILQRAERLTAEELRARPELVSVAHTVVALKHTDAIQMTNTLRPRLGVGGLGHDAITVDARANRLLLLGTRAELISLLDLVAELDVPVAGGNERAPAADPLGTKPQAGEALRTRVAELEKALAALQRQVGELQKQVAELSRK